MIRRVVIPTALFVLLLYVGALVFGIDTLRKSQIAELQGEVNLTAQSVAMSLVPAVAKLDESLARSNIDHVYDDKRHLAMVLLGADGKALVERISSRSARGVPEWFASLLQLPEFTGRVPVAAGSGEHVVEVVLRSERASRRIWGFALKLSWLFAVVGICLCALLSLLLRSSLRPLRHARKVATEIVDGTYSTDPHLPTNAPGEVGGVLNDTNRASWHVGQLHNEWRETVGILETERETDHVTGLLNRYGAHTRLAQIEAPGFVALLRADGLEDRSRLTGLESSEQYVSNLGATLRGACSSSPGFWVGRIDGGLFAFGHSRFAASHVPPLLDRVVSMIDDSVIDASSVRIGAATFESAVTQSQAMDAAEAALAKAARTPERTGSVRYSVQNISSSEQFLPTTSKQQLLAKLGDGSLKLNYRPVIDTNDKAVAHVVVPWLVEDADLIFKDEQARAQYEAAGLEADFDFAMLDLLDKATENQTTFIVSVSTATLADDAARSRLIERLGAMGPQRPMIEFGLDLLTRDGAARLDLEIVDHLEAAGLPYVLSTGGGGRSGSGVVTQCRPAFLKLSPDVGRLFGSTDERSADASRTYVTQLAQSLKSHGVAVMLDGVDTRDTWEAAKAAGIVAALGHFPGIATSSLPTHQA